MITIFLESTCSECGHTIQSSVYELDWACRVILRRAGAELYDAILSSDGRPARALGEAASAGLEKLRANPAGCIPVHEFATEGQAWAAYGATLDLLRQLIDVAEFSSYIVKVEE